MIICVATFQVLVCMDKKSSIWFMVAEVLIMNQILLIRPMHATTWTVAAQIIVFPIAIFSAGFLVVGGRVVTIQGGGLTKRVQVVAGAEPTDVVIPARLVPPQACHVRLVPVLALRKTPTEGCGHKTTDHPNAGPDDGNKDHDDLGSNRRGATVHGQTEQYLVHD